MAQREYPHLPWKMRWVNQNRLFPDGAGEHSTITYNEDFLTTTIEDRLRHVTNIQ